MLKQINILSLIQARNSLEEDIFSAFLSYHGADFRPAELDDLAALTTLLAENGCEPSGYENFFAGYIIPQIGKEFDLLRFGENFHINIEIKSTSAEKKILRQLRRNKYYLRFLGKQVHHFTFQADTKTLYYLRDDDSLEAVGITALISSLRSQSILKIISADKLFNPSDYLVSPFNSTDIFLDGGYFLTSQQEEIQSIILSVIDSATTANFISLTGGPGTGKTLLAYDIVRRVIDNDKKPLVIHCGLLNGGHEKLIEAGWKIVPIRCIHAQNLADFDFILVDEAQRLRQSQIEKIKDEVYGNSGNCLFAFDRLQTLNTREESCDAGGQILEICNGNNHALSDKIRTNKEIANFVKSLLNNRKNFGDAKSDNIEIRYFDTASDVKDFLDSLNDEDWEVLRFTPSKTREFHEEYSRLGSKNSHEVIGQEFEGVAVVIDEHFTYDNDGNLIYSGSTYYSAPKMLFQNITRARKRLLIVVQSNKEILERCMSIA